jgi:hypothetical protein
MAVQPLEKAVSNMKVVRALVWVGANDPVAASIGTKVPVR